MTTLISVFLVTLAIFGASVLGLAIGVVLSDRRLKGTCGGLSQVTGEGGECQMCGTTTNECQDK